jgi:hypothetical protein
MRLLVPFLVVALAQSASADKVDWSQYIDKNPSAPLRTTPAPTPAAKPAPAKRAEKVAAKPKAKPPTKPRARR